jgi:hypothetical protein
MVQNKKPQYVVIHCGTNDLESYSKPELESSFKSIIKEVKWHTGGTNIILSGLIYRLDKPDLNGRIDTVNTFLQRQESKDVIFVDHNPTFRDLTKVLNNSGLHLRHVGKRQVAENIHLAMMGANQKPERNQVNTADLHQQPDIHNDHRGGTRYRPQEQQHDMPQRSSWTSQHGTGRGSRSNHRQHAPAKEYRPPQKYGNSYQHYNRKNNRGPYHPKQAHRTQHGQTRNNYMPPETSRFDHVNLAHGKHPYGQQVSHYPQQNAVHQSPFQNQQSPAEQFPPNTGGYHKTPYPNPTQYTNWEQERGGRHPTAYLNVAPGTHNHRDNSSSTWTPPPYPQVDMLSQPNCPQVECHNQFVDINPYTPKDNAQHTPMPQGPRWIAPYPQVDNYDPYNYKNTRNDYSVPPNIQTDRVQDHNPCYPPWYQMNSSMWETRPWVRG